MNKMNFWLEEQEGKTGNYDGSSSYRLASAQLPSLSSPAKKKKKKVTVSTMYHKTMHSTVALGVVW